MVDWMIEVLSSFSCNTNTFFIALDIMDKYLERSRVCQKTRKIHVIGVVSMMIASKIEEIIPFKVNTVVDKMTHGKISKKEVIQTEKEILQTLGFDLYQNKGLYTGIELVII